MNKFNNVNFQKNHWLVNVYLTFICIDILCMLTGTEVISKVLSQSYLWNPTTCPDGKFRCLNGVCIDRTFLCDGMVHCDPSTKEDETYELCHNNKCTGNQFRCATGACIPFWRVCDGYQHCNVDGSDESIEQCRNYQCPMEKFRCNTGACIDKKYVCDGHKHCRVDGRDEFPEVCGKNTNAERVRRLPEPVHPLSEPVCTLPPISADKTYTVECPNKSTQCPHEPGKNVSSNTFITFQCKEGYSHNEGDDFVSSCFKGKWQPVIPKCQRCGKIDGNISALVSGGKPEIRGDSPWHVAIYDHSRSKEPSLICGGTIISANIVISAAHCFYDENLQKLKSVSIYEIAVAKVTRNYRVMDNRETKIYKVEKILIPSEPVAYTGSDTEYASDIAILKTAEKITFNRAVLPACIDWTNSNRFVPAKANSVGKLVGWGETEERKASEVLLATLLPYISLANCRRLVSEEFANTIAIDKFCAGEVKGAGARLGDGGGGLVFRDSITGLYYLRGIASNRDVATGEKETAIAAFTDVAQYLEWIRETRIQIENKELLSMR